MASIKGKNTDPELALRKALHRLGFRYILHDRRLPGQPDIVLPKYKAAVFVHGCFWHRHIGCNYTAMPASNRKFWERKFSHNIERDRRNIQKLRESGWRVLIVWECVLKKHKAEIVANMVSDWLLDRNDRMRNTAYYYDEINRVKLRY